MAGDLEIAHYVKNISDFLFGRTVLTTTTKKVTGQITVTTAGTAVQGGNVDSPGGFFIKALSGNTGKVYFGNNGFDDVMSVDGFELAAGDLMWIQVKNLNELWFDAATGGDKFCWSKA